VKPPVSRDTLSTLVGIAALIVTVELALWSAALSVKYATQSEDTLALIGRKVMDEDKRWAIPRSNNPDVLLLIGRSDSLWSRGDSAGRIRALEDALQLDRKNVSAHQRLGLAYGIRGDARHDTADFRRALVHYNAALEDQNALGGEATLWTKSLRRGTRLALGEPAEYPAEFVIVRLVSRIIVGVFLAAGTWLVYEDVSSRNRKLRASGSEDVC
jgi:hypothetical protein